MIFFMVRLRNETLNELPNSVTSPDWQGVKYVLEFLTTTLLITYYLYT